MFTLNIAIVGGGPADILLARLLHLASIPYTVFELDASAFVLIDSGSLDLHEATAQATLKAARLHEEFLKLLRMEGKAVRFSDPTGHLYIGDPGTSDRNKREINRQDPWKIILAVIPPETIYWGEEIQDCCQI